MDIGFNFFNFKNRHLMIVPLIKTSQYTATANNHDIEKHMIIDIVWMEIGFGINLRFMTLKTDF